MATVKAFEFRDYGVDHAQYFQGAGTAYTDWDQVYVGVGDSAFEAGKDALDSLCSGAEHVTMETFLDLEARASELDNAEDAHAECDLDDDDGCELNHYVALFVQFH
jgi:hypothetical protein